MPAGTFVTHFGKQVHFDGAKTEDAMLLIVGEGPATSTPAESSRTTEQEAFAMTALRHPKVCFLPEADIGAPPPDVRFTPKGGHR